MNASSLTVSTANVLLKKGVVHGTQSVAGCFGVLHCAVAPSPGCALNLFAALTRRLLHPADAPARPRGRGDGRRAAAAGCCGRRRPAAAVPAAAARPARARRRSGMTSVSVLHTVKVLLEGYSASGLQGNCSHMPERWTKGPGKGTFRSLFATNDLPIVIC